MGGEYMARKRIATGLSVNEILNMPISKLSGYTTTEQRELISRVASAANKRLNVLSKQGIENSATLRLDLSGGKISVRGKSGDELIKEYIRARDFMRNKFSKSSEWKKTIKNISKKSDSMKGIPEKDVSQAFGYYEILREMEPEIVNKINKYEYMDYVSGILLYEPENRDEVIRKSLDWIHSEYKRAEREYNSMSSRFGDAIEYDIPPRLERKKKRKRK